MRPIRDLSPSPKKLEKKGSLYLGREKRKDGGLR